MEATNLATLSLFLSLAISVSVDLGLLARFAPLFLGLNDPAQQRPAFSEPGFSASLARLLVVARSLWEIHSELSDFWSPTSALFVELGSESATRTMMLRESLWRGRDGWMRGAKIRVPAARNNDNSAP